MQTIRFTILTLFLALAVLTEKSQAQLYTYLQDTTGLYSSIAANTNSTNLVRFNGATRPAAICQEGFSSTSFTPATGYSSALQGVKALIAPNAGYGLNVTGFSIGLRRSSTGPNDAMLAYSTDGGATWIAQGSLVNPNNASCGNPTAFNWTVSFPVAYPAQLLFAVFGYDASGSQGTMQIMNLTISGSVESFDTISTTATAFGPYCAGTAASINVPFTVSGGATGNYFVQLSDSNGSFPASDSSNLISAGGSSSPLTASIPAGTPAGSGYRVRVVDPANPFSVALGDNGSNIQILPTLSPSLTVTPSQSSICPGENVVFNVTATVGAGTAPVYQWYVNHTAVGTGSSYASAALANHDSVYCIMTSNYACTSPLSTATSNLTIMSVSSLVVINLYDSLCPGGSTVFNGHSLSAAGQYTDTAHTTGGCDSITILHLFIKGIKTATIPVTICAGSSYTFGGHSYSAAGTYRDTVRCDSIATLDLSVNALPVVSWVQADTVLKWCGSSTFLLLQGESPAGGVFSGSYVSSDSLYNNGVNEQVWVYYTYTDADHCSAKDSTLFGLSICNGISGPAEQASFELYPNPVEGMLHISASGNEGLAGFSVCDVLGHALLKETFATAKNTADIDLSGLASGLYILSLRDTGNRTLVRQIVKQ